MLLTTNQRPPRRLGTPPDSDHVASVFGKFVVYGLIGWAVEVVFTGASAALFEKDKSATAKTYLWMHPIYGAAGLLLEWMAKKLRSLPEGAKPLAYVPVIYGVEYVTGWALRRTLGHCPWDYKDRGLNFHGLIRLDYAPAWLLAGYLFTPVARRVEHALRPLEDAAQAAGVAVADAAKAAGSAVAEAAVSATETALEPALRR